MRRPIGTGGRAAVMESHQSTHGSCIMHPSMQFREGKGKQRHSTSTGTNRAGSTTMPVSNRGSRLEPTWVAAGRGWWRLHQQDRWRATTLARCSIRHYPHGPALPLFRPYEVHGASHKSSHAAASWASIGFRPLHVTPDVNNRHIRMQTRFGRDFSHPHNLRLDSRRSRNHSPINSET